MQISATDHFLSWEPRWKIDKFNDPDGKIEVASKAGISLDEIKAMGGYLGAVEFEPNLLLNNGITVFLELLDGIAGPPAFNGTNARLGVGDSTTAAAATQTGLQAATNFYYQVVDAGYPTVSAQTSTWRATFGTSVANFAWNEFIVDNDGAAGSGSTAPTYSSTLVALNRLVSAQGTKISGQTWILSLNLTVS